jgi:hypothetical protein
MMDTKPEALIFQTSEYPLRLEKRGVSLRLAEFAILHLRGVESGSGSGSSQETAGTA